MLPKHNFLCPRFYVSLFSYFANCSSNFSNLIIIMPPIIVSYPFSAPSSTSRTRKLNFRHKARSRNQRV